MASKIPSIGATGIFVLTTPYTVENDVVYRCSAIRSYSELVSEGVNVFSTYYEPKGLLEAQLEADILEGVHIVTLSGMSGDIVRVPSTFIESFPDNNTVTYMRTILSVDLGPLPTYLNYMDVMAEMEDVCLQHIGVVVGSNKSFGPLRDNSLTYSEHQIAESNRLASVTKVISDAAKIRELEAKLEASEATRTALEDWCIDNGYLGS